MDDFKRGRVAGGMLCKFDLLEGTCRSDTAAAGWFSFCADDPFVGNCKLDRTAGCVRDLLVGNCTLDMQAGGMSDMTDLFLGSCKLESAAGDACV